MITEIVLLQVRPGQCEAFESAFRRAGALLRGVKGYLAHELQRCVEIESRYQLRIEWEKLEDHTEGFRKSAVYQDWKTLLHHFYDPFPEVMHYKKIIQNP